jgi:hypothetical protein
VHRANAEDGGPKAAATQPGGDDDDQEIGESRTHTGPSPRGYFLEVLILNDFKSLWPELLILKGLKRDFSELLILEELRAKLVPLRLISRESALRPAANATV